MQKASDNQEIQTEPHPLDSARYYLDDFAVPMQMQDVAAVRIMRNPSNPRLLFDIIAVDAKETWMFTHKVGLTLDAASSEADYINSELAKIDAASRGNNSIDA